MASSPKPSSHFLFPQVKTLSSLVTVGAVCTMNCYHRINRLHSENCVEAMLWFLYWASLKSQIDHVAPISLTFYLPHNHLPLFFVVFEDAMHLSVVFFFNRYCGTHYTVSCPQSALAYFERQRHTQHKRSEENGQKGAGCREVGQCESSNNTMINTN